MVAQSNILIILFIYLQNLGIISLMPFLLQAVVNNLEDAHELIDTAISTALKESKPVYISVGCNLAGIPHPTFVHEPVPFSLSPKYVSSQPSAFLLDLFSINNQLFYYL